MASLSKGFTASYKAGSEAIAKCYVDDGNFYEFIDTNDAWAFYKPVAYSNNSNVVRAGRYSEAKREFQKLSTVAAMNNTANILMIERNYSAAAAQYRAVLNKDPNNKTAQQGLEDAKSKLE